MIGGGEDLTMTGLTNLGRMGRSGKNPGFMAFSLNPELHDIKVNFVGALSHSNQSETGRVIQVFSSVKIVVSRDINKPFIGFYYVNNEWFLFYNNYPILV